MGIFDKLKTTLGQGVNMAAQSLGNKRETFTFPALPESLAALQALPEADLPKEYLDICLNSCEDKHLVTLRARGPAARRLVERLQEGWPSLQGVDPVAL